MKEWELEVEKRNWLQAKYSSKDLETLTFDSYGNPLKLQSLNTDKLPLIQLTDIPIRETESSNILKGFDKTAYQTAKQSWY